MPILGKNYDGIINLLSVLAANSYCRKERMLPSGKAITLVWKRIFVLNLSILSEYPRFIASVISMCTTMAML